MENYEDNLKAYNSRQLRACQLRQLEILKTIDRVCARLGLRYWLDSGTLLGAVRHGGFIPWDDDIDIAMDKKDLQRFAREAQALLPDNLFVQTPLTDPHSKEPIVKVRDLNSLYIEPGDHFITDYKKGIFVDIFPFEPHPGIPRKWARRLLKSLSKSNSILHHLHYYSLRAFAEFFWFGAKRAVCHLLWKMAYAMGSKKRYGCDPFLTGYGVTHDRDAVFPLGTVHFEDADFPAPHDPDRYLRDAYGDYMQIPPAEKRYFHALFVMPKLK